MSYNYDDPAHEEDMRQLRREQLHADISPEEAAEECALMDEQNDDFYYEDDDDYNDPNFLYDYEVES